jgi:hypothetical protein
MAKNDLSESLSEIRSIINEYLNARLDLIKLSLLQRITRAGTYLLTFVSILVSVFAMTIFLMFSFSYWYGDNYGSHAGGFLISAGFYLLLLILIYTLRKIVFSRNIIKIFSNIIFNDDENDKS